MAALPGGSIPALDYISRSVFHLEQSQELGGGWGGLQPGKSCSGVGAGGERKQLQAVTAAAQRKLFFFSHILSSSHCLEYPCGSSTRAMEVSSCPQSIC